MIGTSTYDMAGMYADTITLPNGCDSIINLNLALINAVINTIDTAICDGNSIMIGTSTYDMAGMYADTIILSNGCDSIINLSLAIIAPVLNLIDSTICNGQTVTIGTSVYTTTDIYSDTLTSINGCDSIVNLDLTVIDAVVVDSDSTICNGQSVTIGTSVYTTTDMYSDTLASINGCDSIINLNLMVIDAIIVDIDSTICNGESVTIGTSVYTTTDIYSDTLSSINGCDSIVNLDLKVIDAVVVDIDSTVCNGQSVTIGTSVYTTTDMYSDTLASINGCDSIVNLDLTVIDAVVVDIDSTICNGQSVTIATSVYTTTDMYSDTLTSINGCDSIVNLDLTVIDAVVVDIDSTICNGQSVTIGTSVYTTTDMYSDTLTSINGCDSIVNLDLTVIDAIVVDMDSTICNGQSVTIGTSVYTTTDIYSDTLTSINGCDSIVNLDLTVIDAIVVDIDSTICNGQSVTIGTSVYTTTDIYSDTLTSINGCDSIVNLDLTVIDAIVVDIDSTICNGQSVTIGTSVYTTTDMYSDTLTSINGCDSIVNLDLTAIDAIVVDIDSTICNGQSVTIATSVYTTTDMYSDTLVSINGCDSIINLDLMVIDAIIVDIDSTICNGQSVTIGTNVYTTTDMYSDTLASINGCDSIINLNLMVIDAIIVDIDSIICNGESVTIGTSVYTTTDMYSDTLASINGCDSIINLDLMVIDAFIVDIDSIICIGETVTIGSSIYSTTNMYSDTLVSVNGCDSIINLDLSVIDLIEPTFDPIGPFCPTDAMQTLPTTSTNGISGNWSGMGVAGNMFDPSAGSQEIIFTPDAGSGCADNDTVMVIVELAACPCDIDTVIVTNIECNNNNTPNDPNDDLYSFDIEVQGSNVAPDWTIASPQVNATGTYNTITNIGPLNIADGTINLTVTDDNNSTCTFDFSVEPPVTCSDDCDIDMIIIENITCFDNNTPTDPLDDTFTFDITVEGSGVGTAWLSNVNINGNPDFPYSTTINAGPYLISSGDFNLQVFDIDGGERCSDAILIVAPEPCSDECVIQAPVVENIVCDPGLDPTDPADDTYTFNITVTGFNVAGSWIADDPNSSIGVYNATLTLGPYTIADGVLNFTIEDMDDPTCSVDVSVVPPPTCSDLCLIQGVVISDIVCDPGVDLTDPADDSFTFMLNVSAVNSGANWTADDPLNSNGGYNINVMMGPYLISGGDLSFTLTDIDNPACNTLVEVASPGACSDLCVISAVSVSEVNCNNSGTSSDPTDDTFTFEVNVSGLNTSTWSGGDLSGENYGSAVEFGPFEIADGTQFITIVDDNDPDCSFEIEVDPPMTCSDDCEIIDVFVDLILCDDNDTPSDPDDDTFTFELIATGFNLSTFGFFATDPNSTEGNYNFYNNFGPYPISQSPMNFRIVDFNNAGCSFNVIVDEVESCSDACRIEDFEIIDMLCDDQGTDNDPTDDTYTYSIIVNSINSSPGWNATDPLLSSGNYGDTIAMGPYLISDGDQTYLLRDNAASVSCNFEVNVAAPASCSFPCSVTDISINNVMCDNANGTVQFDLFVQGENNSGTWTANDPAATSGTYDTNVSFGPYNIADGTFFIVITDAMDDDCLDSIEIDPLALCPPCNIDEALITAIVCDDNNTSSDPLDDSFTFDLTVTGINTASTWTADDMNTTSGDYGRAESLGPFSISDGVFTLIITDNDNPNCSLAVEVTPPNTCSGDRCMITNVTLTDTICDPGTTPNDASDDTYTFNVNLEGNNASSTWIANDPSLTTGDYGTLTPFGPFNIADGTFTLTFTDVNDPDCTFDLLVTPPVTCSPAGCQISNVELSDTICNDNNTPADASDDTFTFNISVSGDNTSMSWVANDAATTTGNYNELVNFGPFNISDGPFSLTISDADDTQCTFDLLITPPESCSPQGCEIINVAYLDTLCNDNNTPADPSDDTYTFNVRVNGNNTAGTWIANDLPATTGNYGELISFGPFNIIDGAFSLTFTDAVDQNCTSNLTVIPPSFCSEANCMLNEIIVSNITCVDPNTPGDPSDDQYTFNVLVSGNNTSTSWSANDMNATTGNYDVVTTFGPFNIADGPINIEFTDSTDPDCNSGIIVTPPNPCSAAFCEIMMIDLDDLLCDDSGTADDRDDDTFTFTLEVNGNNTSSGWNSNFAPAGNYGEKVEFGPFIINDGTVAIQIVDNDDPDCTRAILVSPPPYCSDEVCQINDINVSAISCTDPNTPSVPADDMFTFNLFVIGEMLGDSFTTDDPNTPSGPYNGFVNFGPYLITDGPVTITLSDINDPECSNTITVEPPQPCSVDSCAILEVLVSEAMCDDNNTPDDISDDRFSFVLEVLGTNTSPLWNILEFPGIAGAYNTEFLFGPFPASGGPVSFTFVDSQNGLCEFPITVRPPPECSDCLLEGDAGPLKFLGCDSPTAQLEGSANQVDPITYSWTGPDGFTSMDQNPVVTLPGRYILSVSDTFNCFAIDSVEVISDPDVPIANAGPNVNLNCNDTCLVLMGSSNVTNASYVWSGPGIDATNRTVQNPTVCAQGIYILEVTNTDNNCVSSPDTVVVENNINEIRAIIQPANDINCYSTTVRLDGSESTIGTNIGYQWRTIEGSIISNSINANITQAGTFVLLAIDTMNGCFGADTVEVLDFIEYPGANAGEDQTLADCEADTAVVMGTSIASPLIITYSWRPEDGGNIAAVIDERTIEVNLSGSYILGVLDTTNGCESYDTMQIFQNFEEGEAVDDNFTVDKNTTLSGLVGQNDNFSELGNFTLVQTATSGLVNINPETGSFTYAPVRDFVGEDFFEYVVCSELCPDVCDTAFVFIRVLDREGPPNAISPNGDGQNDVWVIPESVNYEFRRLTVVNRWGDIVYESREYNNDWGGTYKGNLLPEGTYYYILELENGPEDRKIYRSHITIIR